MSEALYPDLPPFKTWICKHDDGDVLVPVPEECPRCGNHGPTGTSALLSDGRQDEAAQIVTRECLRCARPCVATRPPGEDARVLRRSLGDGLCANCAITDFLRRMSPLDIVLERQGPEVLLVPAIQAQVGRVLEAGNADASLAEIDWPTVVANWHLPVKGGTLC